MSAKNPNPDLFVPHNWGEQGSDIHLHAMAAGSRANGPGLRAVIWLQGCTLGCPGCFNTPTHPQSGGEWLAVDALFERIQSLAPGLEGLTVSGGEPLQQIGPLSALLGRVRSETSLSVIVFTGFSAAELERLPGMAALKASVDVLIAGRYEQDQRLARGPARLGQQTPALFDRALPGRRLCRSARGRNPDRAGWAGHLQRD